jgi:hypothetical protein
MRLLNKHIIEEQLLDRQELLNHLLLMLIDKWLICRKPEELEMNLEHKVI